MTVLTSLYKKRMHEDGRLYGKYKVKPNKQIPIEDLENALDGKTLSDGHTPHFVKPLRDKSFLVFTYHVGTRKMEATEVTKDDMVIDKDFLTVSVPAFKGGERAAPLKINRTWLGIDLVVKQWQKTKPKHKLWNISESTAYRIIVRALGKCPHWLRHNWITTKQKVLKGEPSEVDRKIQSWTGIKRRATLDNYRMKMKEDIEEIANLEK